MESRTIDESLQFLKRIDEIRVLAERAFRLLKNKNLSIAVAESITAGGFVHYLTSVPGSSSVVTGGIVAYTIPVKVAFLDVGEMTIQKFGVVSKEVAIEMANGIRDKFMSGIGMGVTGYAGPSGGDEFAPVGRVYWGIVGPGGQKSLQLSLEGDREGIRLESIKRGMQFLIENLL